MMLQGLNHMLANIEPQVLVSILSWRREQHFGFGELSEKESASWPQFGSLEKRDLADGGGHGAKHATAFGQCALEALGITVCRRERPFRAQSGWTKHRLECGQSRGLCQSVSHFPNLHGASQAEIRMCLGHLFHGLEADSQGVRGRGAGLAHQPRDLDPVEGPQLGPRHERARHGGTGGAFARAPREAARRNEKSPKFRHPLGPRVRLLSKRRQPSKLH